MPRTKYKSEEEMMEALPVGLPLRVRLKGRFSKHRRVHIEETVEDLKKNENSGLYEVETNRFFVGSMDKATKTPQHMRVAKSRARNKMAKESRRRNRKKK